MRTSRLVVDARGFDIHRGRGIGRVIEELLGAMTRVGIEADVAGTPSVRPFCGPSLRFVHHPARHLDNILSPGRLSGEGILRLAPTSPGPDDARTIACCYDLMPLKAPLLHYPWRSRLRRPLAWPAMRHAFDIYARVRTVWSISRATALDAERMLGVAPERSAVVPLAAPTWARGASAAEVADLRQRHELPNTFVLWVLSGFNDNKNVTGMLRAVAATKELPPLFVAGAFARKSAAKLARAARRAGATYRSLGFISDDDLRALMAAATCVAVPSRDEGYALPIAEALACGGRVVANDIAVLKELAHPRVTFADAMNPRAFGDALLAATRTPPPFGSTFAPPFAPPFAPSPGRTWDDVAREVVALTAV